MGVIQIMAIAKKRERVSLWNEYIGLCRSGKATIEEINRAFDNYYRAHPTHPMNRPRQEKTERATEIGAQLILRV